MAEHGKSVKASNALAEPASDACRSGLLSTANSPFVFSVILSGVRSATNLLSGMPVTETNSDARRLAMQGPCASSSSKEDIVTFPPESFGEAIYTLRVLKGEPQAAIAARANLSAGYYSELENGKRCAPPKSTARRIASAVSANAAEVARLVAIADAERTATLHDAHLPPAVRELVATIRVAAPHLPIGLVELLHAKVKESRM